METKAQNRAIAIVITTLVTLLFLISLTGCSTPRECSHIVEPNDSTNYNATYILP